MRFKYPQPLGSAVLAEPQHQIGCCGPRSGATNDPPARLDRRCREARRVDQRDGKAADIEMDLDHVTRRAGNGETIAALRRASALSRVDLPALGGPAMTTTRPSRRRSPARPPPAPRDFAPIAAQHIARTRPGFVTSASSAKSISASISASASRICRRQASASSPRRRPFGGKPGGAGFRSPPRSDRPGPPPRSGRACRSRKRGA